jgi:c-di-GMP-related signal transduction protein
MATYPASVKRPHLSVHTWVGEVRYIARQPILNLQGHVHAYELLFRNPPEAVSPHEGDAATQAMFDNAVIFGLERFTNGLPAFVSCTLESLTEQMANVLAPDTTILAIPASLEPAPALIESCLDLKAKGFRLALDDLIVGSTPHPLIDLVDYIRVDFVQLSEDQRQNLRKLASPSRAILAKKLDTQEDYRQACAAGFTLFQGGYFCNPVLLKERKVPASRLVHFDIVRLLLHDPLDIRQVSKLVMRDPSLTFRLLRLVNSPVYAIQQEVRSVETAILLVGEDTFRRIVSLAVLCEVNADQPPEILHMALLRARFCQLAAELFDLEPGEQYLLGLFSLLPAMLCLPMEEIIPALPLRDRICEALLQTMNRERTALSWLEGHERGDWEACDSILIANDPNHEHFRLAKQSEQPSLADQLIRCYADAVVWVEASLSLAA